MDFHTLSPSFPTPELLDGGCAPLLTWNYPQTSWKKPEPSVPPPPGSSSPPSPTGLAASNPRATCPITPVGRTITWRCPVGWDRLLQVYRPDFLGKPSCPERITPPCPNGSAPRLAGLGILGRHGLVIVPPYGSWVFLGTILTDLPLPSASTPAPDCPGCNACIRACPSGALTEAGCDIKRCLSDLTQKKGTLTEEQEAQLQAHPLIWGCDFCQLACPYNRDAQPSPLPELTGQAAETPYLPSLSSEDLEGLTNRTFRAAFGNRAFAWRGPAVLRRNLAWKDEKKGDKL